MSFARDTICALATGRPPSAISVIRISGPAVIYITEQLLSGGVLEPRKSMLRKLRNAAGVEIDTGLVLYMPGPKSYTGEDTVEISLHGGTIIVEKALKACMEAGARLAEPGEFTRRAFEAGKLDLTRAEAVADLIEAETEAQHTQALKQMDGALAHLYADWREQLTECLALLEASIDFPDEEDAPDRIEAPVQVKLEALKTTFEMALAEGNVTERIRDGFKVAILGKPNAGKSTLLNQLSKRDAAIVTDIPGTTRDIVEVRLVLGGYLVWLSDTAGLRETDDVVEAEGVRRALKAASEADIRIWLYDIREQFDQSDQVQPGDIIVANKSDLVDRTNVSRETLFASAASGLGIPEIEAAIVEALTDMHGKVSAPLLTRARHRQGIEAAVFHVKQAQTSLNQSYGAELIAEEVRLAARKLGELTGHVDTESILGAVFSSFCIGK